MEARSEILYVGWWRSYVNAGDKAHGDPIGGVVRTADIG
jgi:hypothetical protein